MSFSLRCGIIILQLNTEQKKSSNEGNGKRIYPWLKDKDGACCESAFLRLRWGVMPCGCHRAFGKNEGKYFF